MPIDERGAYRLPKDGGEEWKESQQLLAAMRKAGIPLEELPVLDEQPTTEISESELQELESILASVPASALDRADQILAAIERKSVGLRGTMHRVRRSRGNNPQGTS